MGAANGRLSSADLEATKNERAEEVPTFQTRVVHPFVLAAQGRDDARDAEATIVWARDRLRADFFDKEPGKPITIWVFRDEASYMSGSSALVGLVPSTPYGFYRPCSRVMVVNAGLGFGTLVHEMVHAYMDADFPSAPTWMNEGLASLFEAPIEIDGHLRGKINWRLPGLQRALREGRGLGLSTLAKGSRGDFDGKRGALYYASARYLLLWLQDQGHLGAFYRSYRARGGDGLDVLQEVTRRDLAGIERAWERFVLDLAYEPAIASRR